MSAETERTLPTAAQVFEALCRYYRDHKFNWEYSELYAELAACAPSSGFAKRAQALTRIEYPEFQKRANVLTTNGQIRPNAVKRQALAAADILRRALREGWMASSPSDANAPGEQAIELRWQGPFDLLAGGSLALASMQSVAGWPGIYLWTVQVRDAFHINYLGKTNRSFAVRLSEEIDYERHQARKHFDVDAFAREPKGFRCPAPRTRRSRLPRSISCWV
jgi:hypothetical protein